MLQDKITLEDLRNLWRVQQKKLLQDSCTRNMEQIKQNFVLVAVSIAKTLGCIETQEMEKEILSGRHPYAALKEFLSLQNKLTDYTKCTIEIL